MSNSILSLTKDEKSRAQEKKMPAWTQPMLARLTHDHFSDENWIYERKLDGERVLAFSRNNNVVLMSRNKRKLNDIYPELVEALKDQDVSQFIADGEVVAFDGDVTSFARLQNRMHAESKKSSRGNVAVYYYLFDLIYVDGFDISDLQLRDRKRILKQSFDFNNRIRYTVHRNKDGEKYHAEACEKGWEGVIAKDARSKYVHSRSSKWLKFKCVNRQEFVIGGFTEPEGERIGFGALLIGYYENGDLRYAGKVGTGYDDELLQDLGGRLKKMERESCPFDEGDIDTKKVHWIRTELVGEVGFTEWTSDGKLRHPRFIGLRHDKKAEEVSREG